MVELNSGMEYWNNILTPKFRDWVSHFASLGIASLIEDKSDNES